jgi:hypothetical protein
VRTNLAGEVSSVTALDPDTVLSAYCGAGRGARRTPLRLVEERPGRRVGLFHEAGELYAIPILMDPRSGEWSAGNGVEPLVATKAPAARAATR